MSFTDEELELLSDALEYFYQTVGIDFSQYETRLYERAAEKLDRALNG